MNYRTGLVAAMLLLGLCSPVALPAFAQFEPLGSKFACAEKDTYFQGSAVAISADVGTVLIGAGSDIPGFDGGACVWALNGDSFAQQGKLLIGSGISKPNDILASIRDPFPTSRNQGGSVGLSADGNTAIIGGMSGVAWVWTRSHGVWSQQGPRLVGSGEIGIRYDNSSVALSADGNTAVVGFAGDNDGRGAFWVWTRKGAAWTQQGTKHGGTEVGSNGQACGSSVALSADGNAALIGCSGDQDGIGAAAVWTRANGVWSQPGRKLVGKGAVGKASQGSSVAISADGNTAIIGGSGDDDGLGAAWVWTRTNGVWSQQGSKLVGAGAAGKSLQGSSVALSASGDIALVGGMNDRDGIGATWAWVRNSGQWTQAGSKLVGLSRLDVGGRTYEGVGGKANQGKAVALSINGELAVIGGPKEDVPTGFHGAVWLFAIAEH